MDEQVALYDDRGRPCGLAPRRRVRAANLRHAATAVVVRDRLGRVYVHRRTEGKDLYPGRHDFACGGVVTAGEDPHAAAVRELAEELGVTGVELEPLGEADYADEHTRYHAFRYSTSWDGPVRWQPEEVAWGAWMTLDRLVELLASPEWSCMPDTRALFADWLADRLADRVTPTQGWDTVTTLVEGRWVDRLPRRPAVARQLLTETRLLPRLAPSLPLAVPVPEVLDDDPLRVRHPLVVGHAADPARLTAADGAAVGTFLRALHDTAPEVWAGTGVPTGAETRADLGRFLAECRERVLPRVPSAVAADAAALLAEVLERSGPTADAPAALVHGDLGPEHLLVDRGRVRGVVDWGDARVDDPAADLAWTLHGTAAAFADAVVDAYAATPDERHRGLLWHRLGPWYEAHWGVSGGPATHLAKGIPGIVARLTAPPRRP